MAVVNPEQTRVVSSNIEGSQGLAPWEGTRGPIQVQNLKSTNSDILAIQGCTERAFEDLKRSLSYEGVQVQPNVEYTDRGAPVTKGEGSTVMWNPSRYTFKRQILCTYYGFDSEGHFVQRPNTIVELLDRKTNKTVAVASVHLLKKEKGILQLGNVLKVMMKMCRAETKIIAGDFGRKPEEIQFMSKKFGFQTDGAIDSTNVSLAEKHDYVFVKGEGSKALTSHPPTGFNPAGSNHIPVVTQLFGQPPSSSPTGQPEPAPSGTSTTTDAAEPTQEDALRQGLETLEKTFPPNSIPGRILRRRERILCKYSQEMRPVIELTILAALFVAAPGDPLGFTGRLLGAIKHSPNIDKRIHRENFCKQMEDLIDHSMKYSDGNLAFRAGISKLMPQALTIGLTLGFGWQWGLATVGSVYAFKKMTRAKDFSFKDALLCLPTVIGSLVSSTYPIYYGLEGLGAGAISTFLINKFI